MSPTDVVLFEGAGVVDGGHHDVADYEVGNGGRHCENGNLAQPGIEPCATANSSPSSPDMANSPDCETATPNRPMDSR